MFIDYQEDILFSFSKPACLFSKMAYWDGGNYDYSDDYSDDEDGE